MKGSACEPGLSALVWFTCLFLYEPVNFGRASLFLRLSTICKRKIVHGIEPSKKLFHTKKVIKEKELENRKLCFCRNFSERFGVVRAFLGFSCTRNYGY